MSEKWGAQDVMHLKAQVCFLFCILYILLTIIYSKLCVHQENSNLLNRNLFLLNLT